MKRFHFSTVLGIIHNQKLSGETASLLSYILNKQIRDEQVIELMPSCRDDLLKQFPNLNSDEIRQAFIKLNQDLDVDSNNFVCPAEQIGNWLTLVFPLCKCEEMLTVQKHQQRVVPDMFKRFKRELQW